MFVWSDKMHWKQSQNYDHGVSDLLPTMQSYVCGENTQPVFTNLIFSCPFILSFNFILELGDMALLKTTALQQHWVHIDVNIYYHLHIIPVLWNTNDDLSYNSGIPPSPTSLYITLHLCICPLSLFSSISGYSSFTSFPSKAVASNPVSDLSSPLDLGNCLTCFLLISHFIRPAIIESSLYQQRLFSLSYHFLTVCSLLMFHGSEV